ncbi:hypothetical protein POX_b02394 [Penicillium oxalicum]|uniref:hypothetical protein n=1 Tax=Penicillium oxalicum TaxID=69781 RepID=UPI0020B79281|nr:hypothetical protein POX_b02394 [Penicillium oxalicum]KAI2792357.1 hypothetical protein POX_b02394 [Penicillium oxalicum]
MPPKKGSRKSMPAQVNHDTPSLVPSRRSRRISLAAPATNTSDDSPKTSVVASATGAESGPSLNIHFYTPKTPKTPSTPQSPSHTPSQASTNSPDVTSTRRSTFKPRPSRLSSVFPPSSETPQSVQSNRRTRRTAALETPQSVYSDYDMSESFGSTGWTYSQYMGGNGMDGASDPRPSPSISSMGTRTSMRVRKPTVKALESMQSQQKAQSRSLKKETSSSNVNNSAPDASSEASPASRSPVHSGPSSAAFPASASKNSSGTTTRFPKLTFKNGLKPATRAASTRKVIAGPAAQPKSDHKDNQAATKSSPQVPGRIGKKDKNVAKCSLRRIQTTVGRTGQKLYELAMLALGTDFMSPPDPDQFLQDVRAAHSERLGLNKQTESCENQPENGDTSAAGNVEQVAADVQSKDKAVLKLSLSAPPFIDEENWAHTGRINDHGEELVLMPPNYTLDRAPHTYGDRSLPYPPIRARPEIQAMTDDTIGYPPRIGERNSPFDIASKSQINDVNKGAGKKAVPRSGPVRKGGRKRRIAEADSPDNHAVSPAAPGSENRQRAQKRRKEETNASASASTKQAARQTPVVRSGKAKAHVKAHASFPREAETPSSKVQRLRITVKPQGTKDAVKEEEEKEEKEEEQKEEAPELQESHSQPSAGRSRQKASGPSSRVKSAQKLTKSKGKQRGAALLDAEDVGDAPASPTTRTGTADSSSREQPAKAQRSSRGRGSGRKKA